MQFNHSQLSELEKRYRVNLINSLSGYKSPHLVGTINEQGLTNLAIFSNIFHLGADPALMGMIVRPDSVDRHTLSNIRQQGYYSFNSVTGEIYQQAHQTSARYQSVSEFSATGLSETYVDNFPAPFVAQSPFKIGLYCREIKAIELNGTFLVIGEVQTIVLPENVVHEDGFINHHQLRGLAVSGLDAYYQTRPLQRLSYAKPDKLLESKDF